MNEFASKQKNQAVVHSIEDVPAFQAHLKRHGFRNLAEWEAHQLSQCGAGDNETMELQARYLTVKARAIARHPRGRGGSNP